MEVNPKKKLGQHFLTDRNIAEKIVSFLKTDSINSILEIGPGKGILTEYILHKKLETIYVVDIDEESIIYLKAKFPKLDNKIIQDDFLKSDILARIESPVGIIGNLPYNISSQIMFKILENKEKVKEVVCMIQKEVAERFVAQPNSKTYGILSVLLQAFFEVNYLFSVSNNVFYPKPKVQSAVVKLVRKENYQLPCSEKMFFKIVKAGFGQRRKTLRNSLSKIIEKGKVENVLFAKRPEQLSVHEFIELTNLITNNTDV
ncbi:MAG: 16S rRNA (adenine(1518)-N(6)/adenine(1519)-N(6))-dimethyltransferase RsmA [Chlorobi bacterium]|nr:16S rRNA (adenine(1518)-N(6)/adenine(1519)-N(6))-dimethyltransferase RsmA [Chlorobiota bacterium]